MHAGTGLLLRSSNRQKIFRYSALNAMKIVALIRWVGHDLPTLTAVCWERRRIFSMRNKQADMQLRSKKCRMS
jgi:hypothetical protein